MVKLLDKQISIENLQQELNQERALGKKIVLCLGVFDLVHPGHIKHFQSAKDKGDILVVAVTANRYVNKGPERPVFDQSLRMESVAAIESVDYVILNDNPDGIHVIEQVAPDFYVKGIEYKQHQKDVTGKIELEASAVAKAGGQIVYTDDVVFSSSTLLNSFFSDRSEQLQSFLNGFKQKTSFSEVNKIVDHFKALNVLVIGDAIIDEYCYVDAMGVAGKGMHLVAKEKSSETYLGGSFAIANHIASFCDNVTLLTAVGKMPASVNLDRDLKQNIHREFIVEPDKKTLVKKRYVNEDGRFLTKLFETYSSNPPTINPQQTQSLRSFLHKTANLYDLVVVADFGNGLIDQEFSNEISKLETFLAINAQINSGNRGYHVVTKYQHADYISLNEPELRLTTHDLNSDLMFLMNQVLEQLSAQYISTTRGVKGAQILSHEGTTHEVPALTSNVVDRVGAGDSYLALSSLALASNASPDIAAFLGASAAALDVQIVGNKKSIEKIPLLKYINTLLK